ncbi:tripartite tricarboxylate transporter substrate binding protein [Piscinibacter sp. XHJ-5]|uniref:Bug family tripartite tricarboxylate transporter substrate binding protein n=1 Tax=Piscinibacter sp. XHJ-5 TaxID=3037797 RepID=UPI002452FEC6|nr:tripartite tricarboxylate transporter substrate binding protein [Piscinibacter sp. XHJ-5]
MPLTRRRAQVAMTGWLLAPSMVPAETAWPIKSVRLVVPYAPAGATDLVARMLAPELTAAFGQPFVVDNRPGGGAIIGTAEVAKAAPDGYTLMVGTIGTHAIGPALFPRLSYDPIKDFTAVSMVAATGNVLVMNPAKARERGIASVHDLVRFATANPGRLNMASAGNGTSIHLAGELFKQMTRTFMVHIPYRGSGPALLDLVAGSVDVMFDAVPSSIAHIRAGRLLPLAVTPSHRVPVLQDVPTVQEAGGPQLRGYEVSSWAGVLGPADMPPDVTARLQRELARIVRASPLKDRWTAEGWLSAGGTSAEFTSLIAAEVKKWGRVVRAAGVRPD